MSFLLIAGSFVAMPLVCAILFRMAAGAKGATYGIGAGLCLWIGATGLFVKVPAFQNAVLERIELQDTVYAPGFRDDLFERVRQGMAATDVLGVLGQPLDRIDLNSQTQLWRYSKQGPKDTNYRIRSIEVTDGRVSKVVRSFFVD